MNGEDREMIARLDTKLEYICAEIKELKDMDKGIIAGCGLRNEKIIKIETVIDNHLKGHKEIYLKIGAVVAIISVMANIVAAFII